LSQSFDSDLAASSDGRRELIPVEDWLLQDFVLMANEAGSSVGVTLTVGGVLVTGMLIGAKQYFESLGDLLAAAIPDRAAAASMREKYVTLGAEMHKRHLAYMARLEAGKEGEAPTFLHLRDARVYAGPSVVPTRGGVLWRGRISAVDGFIVGIINSSETAG
jgi:hypothetical protein